MENVIQGGLTKEAIYNALGYQSENGTLQEGWERKIIALNDIVSDDIDVSIEPLRGWMLGGKNMEWRYHKDKVTGDLIIERR